jgi:CBS domain-containing protein
MIITGHIRDVLERKGPHLWSIHPDTMVFAAIQELAARNIGALPVLEEGRLLGVLSERDYTRKVALEGRSSKSTRVRDILAEAVTVGRADPVEEAMRRMTEQRVRHLVVTEGTAVVGIVSIGDLVNWIIEAQDAAIHQLEGYIAGHYAV